MPSQETCLGLTRLYGQAALGQRVVEAMPDYSGLHYSVVAVLRQPGSSAAWVLHGAMNSLAVETYVETQLCLTLAPEDIVVLGNLPSHKAARISQVIAARGARLEYLPPYSADFNPIGLCWAKVKAALRAAKARTLDASVEALGHALRAVTPQDARAWFAYCG